MKNRGYGRYIGVLKARIRKLETELGKARSAGRIHGETIPDESDAINPAFTGHFAIMHDKYVLASAQNPKYTSICIMSREYDHGSWIWLEPWEIREMRRYLQKRENELAAAGLIRVSTDAESVPGSEPDHMFDAIRYAVATPAQTASKDAYTRGWNTARMMERKIRRRWLALAIVVGFAAGTMACSILHWMRG